MRRWLWWKLGRIELVWVADRTDGDEFLRVLRVDTRDNRCYIIHNGGNSPRIYLDHAGAIAPVSAKDDSYYEVSTWTHWRPYTGFASRLPHTRRATRSDAQRLWTQSGPTRGIHLPEEDR